MGVLTETMVRLRGEIGAWRHVRVALQADLARQTGERRARVCALCADFARDRAGARRAWFGPTLSERRAAEIQHHRRLAEEARAKARPDEQPPATPKAEPHRHEAGKPVLAPAARPPVAPLPPSRRPPFKGSKAH